MNKSQGIAAGIFVAAGLLLHPGALFSPRPAVLHDLATNAAQSGAMNEAKGEGPWVASCKYWAPANWSASEKGKGPPVPFTVNETASALNSHPSASVREDTNCKGDNVQFDWRIPAESPFVKPEIRTIIAAVPDPIHTHFSLEFDRTIDSLLQAAGDNSYVSSYYWLPWKKCAITSGGSESSHDAKSCQDPARERQPGLIIFKHVPHGDEPDYPWSSFNRAVYLFLVGETPTSGMNTAQLQNAFRYAADISEGSTVKGQPLTIIGPEFSGSAASLREGIETARSAIQPPRFPSTIRIVGITSTKIASSLFEPVLKDQNITYFSFNEDIDTEQRQFENLLNNSDFMGRAAILVEDGTVYGQAETQSLEPGQEQPQNLKHPESQTKKSKHREDLLVIRFPREISLLRNAHPDESGQAESQSEAAPSPYLPLSLKDPGADDSVPQFSREQSPTSQEAQLMTIARQLQRYRTQFIGIIASDVLDQLFLAQFLHRACPDARLVFFGSDLLFEREIDNVPYIGAITISPYHLTGLTHSSSTRAFADSNSESYYNAASFTFWRSLQDIKKNTEPTLADYDNPLEPNPILHPPLWATAIGTDGYYPLGIIDQCSSDLISILPALKNGVPQRCDPKDFIANTNKPLDVQRLPVYPSLTWVALCILIAVLCVSHSVVLLAASYWSPFTRDVAIKENDHPRRRSMYIHIATAMLFCMAFVVAYPLFPTLRFFRPVYDHNSIPICVITLIAGLVTVVITLLKTWRYAGLRHALDNESQFPLKKKLRSCWRRADLYFGFNAVALATLITVPVVWIWICQTQSVGHSSSNSYLGLFFSFRCLHPGSGVSPVVPILLLLLSWYLWAVLQTLRLRFSPKSRPRLPRNVPAQTAYPLFVSDQELDACKGSQNYCLYKNITCLLITRQVIRRFFSFSRKKKVDFVLAVVYLILFALCVFFIRVESLDRFLWKPGHWPTLYEFLITVLFFPLLMVALTGWLRMIFVWGALRRGLLERLENLPIRDAFCRLHKVGWMSMLRQGGLHEYWRDMARSTESIRQMIHDEDLLACFTPAHKYELEKILEVNSDLNKNIRDLVNQIAHRAADRRPGNPVTQVAQDQVEELDLPVLQDRRDLDLMCAIEGNYAAFCEGLLAGVLIPYWKDNRSGMVASDDVGLAQFFKSSAKSSAEGPNDPSDLHADTNAEEPLYIRVAEEFLAIRYMALIRAVLVNMRYLMFFVSAAFVLAIVAWNSYSFQPRQWINAVFTALLALLGCGIIWVLAQMHRNPILSRITDTKPNELGLQFYFRLVTLGAVPVLTWLTYQFPEIGGGIYKLFQSGLKVMK